MSDTKTQVSPIVAIAAVSMIIFSAVGVGVMTGVIPSSFSTTAEQPPRAKSAAATRAPADQRQPQRIAAAPSKATSEPTRVAAADPAKPAAHACVACGTVASVHAVKQEGEGTGLGAVAGGVVGGVLGNQVGSGSGRKVATVAGAAGGAYAGHQIEKHVKSTQNYNVAVRMDDGSSRTFTYDQEPGFRAGDKVHVVNGMLVLN